MISLIVLLAVILVLATNLLTMRKQAVNSSSMTTEPSSSPSSKSVGQSASKPHKIAFLRGPWIYVRDLNNGKETRLVEGVSPQLNWSGELLAFISVKNDEDIMTRQFPPANRFRILNLVTGQIRDFGGFRARTGNPVWSHDGSKIAVEVEGVKGKKPCIAVLSTDSDRWLANICKIAIDGTGLTTIVRDGDYASYSIK